MAFESVNVHSLKKSLNKLDNFNNNSLIALKQNITKKDWDNPTRICVTNALTKLINEVQGIENKISRCKIVANKIDEYKSLSQTINLYQSRYNSYSYKASNCDDDSYMHDYAKSKMYECERIINNSVSRKNVLRQEIYNLLR